MGGTLYSRLGWSKLIWISNTKHNGCFNLCHCFFNL